MDTHAERHADASQRADEDPSASFLAVPPTSAEVQALYDDDLADDGYVMNLSRVWAYQPGTQRGLLELMGQATEAGALSFRQRAILVAACASAMGDSYCSLAWGGRLAGEAGDDVAASVLRGEDDGLEESERALARWARQVSRDPNGTTMADVEGLRAAGLDDAQIFAVTCFVALRIAFSTVNDALGARPDRELVDKAPRPVREAVAFGRAPVPPAG